MPLLEAFLALALTLLSLAMIATLIVEMIHRIAGTRSENLKTMLGRLYDRELAMIVITERKKSGEKLEGKKEFIKTLMTNPLLREEERADPVKSLLEKASRRLGPTHLKDLATLSPEDLFKGLASTNIGKRIKAKAEAEIDETVDSLSQSFDEIGVVATDLFRRRAQIISLLVGVVVAFIFNANAIRICKSYLDDPQARAKAVARADSALENFQKMTENMKGIDDPYNETIVRDVNSIKTEIEKLGDMDFPIGYGKDVPPRIWFGKKSDSASGKPDSVLKKIALLWDEILLWVLAVSGTGLLIGLGGPFWFNIVRKLTDVLQVVRGGAPAAAGPGDSATVPADPVKSNRDTFKMTGGLPDAVKAQAQLTAASKAAKDADRAVKTAAEALKITLESADKSSNAIMREAVKQAEEALRMATDDQKNAHDLKKKVMAESAPAPK